MKRAGGCGEADEGAVAKVGRGTLSRAGTPRRGAQHGYTTTRGGEGLGVGIETQMRLLTSVSRCSVKSDFTAGSIYFSFLFLFSSIPASLHSIPWKAFYPIPVPWNWMAVNNDKKNMRNRDI